MGRLVTDIGDADSRFLHDLAGHRLFQAFAGLDETGQGRIHAFDPAVLAAQQAGRAPALRVAVGDQHDDRRIGAGKMVVGAFGIGAPAQVSAVVAFRHRPAEAAEDVPAVPMHEAPPVGQQGRLRARHQGADASQVQKLAASGVAAPGEGVPGVFVQLRNIGGEIGGIAVQPQEGHVAGLGED